MPAWRRSPDPNPFNQGNATLSRTFLVTTFLVSASAAFAAQPVDMLLYNGQVITVDVTNSFKSAVAVEDGKVVAFAGAELIGRVAPKQKIDLAGRSLLPGFIDTHVHIFRASKRSVEVSEAKSIEDFKKMVAVIHSPRPSSRLR